MADGCLQTASSRTAGRSIHRPGRRVYPEDDGEEWSEGARWERRLSPVGTVLAALVEGFLSPFS